LTPRVWDWAGDDDGGELDVDGKFSFDVDFDFDFDFDVDVDVGDCDSCRFTPSNALARAGLWASEPAAAEVERPPSPWYSGARNLKAVYKILVSSA